MGWVLYRQGKHAEAIEYLQRARRLGNDPEIDLHLGEAQWAAGDQAAARKTWQEGLARRPGQWRAQQAPRARRAVNPQAAAVGTRG